MKPTYTQGIIGCTVCFGLEFFLIVTWRVVLVMRNRRRDKNLLEQGITEEERIERGQVLGDQDTTDFENPYVSDVLMSRPPTTRDTLLTNLQFRYTM